MSWEQVRNCRRRSSWSVECLKQSGCTYLINNLPEPDFDGAALQSFLSSRVMDKLREFALPHLARSVSKDKEQSVNRVALSTSVGTDNSAERFVEGTDFLTTSIRFEVDEDEFVNGESRGGSSWSCWHRGGYRYRYDLRHAGMRCGRCVFADRTEWSRCRLGGIVSIGLCRWRRWLGMACCRAGEVVLRQMLSEVPLVRILVFIFCSDNRSGASAFRHWRCCFHPFPF